MCALVVCRAGRPPPIDVWRRRKAHDRTRARVHECEHQWIWQPTATGRRRAPICAQVGSCYNLGFLALPSPPRAPWARARAYLAGQMADLASRLQTRAACQTPPWPKQCRRSSGETKIIKQTDCVTLVFARSLQHCIRSTWQPKARSTLFLACSRLILAPAQAQAQASRRATSSRPTVAQPVARPLRVSSARRAGNRRGRATCMCVHPT